ncbi:MAG: ComF family protein [Ruminococcaceae bacterium]|nr:ComF family protein [Oscillospiraceae bacterium]
MTRREFLDRFFYVRTCGGCRQILSYEDCHSAFCSACRKKWKIAKVETCPDCFRVTPECACMPKELSRAGALTLRKLIFYDPSRTREPQNRLIYFLKRHPNRRMAAFVAEEWRRAVEEELLTLGIQNASEQVLLTGVPRGRRARATYGFDQSELLGKALSDAMGIPYRRILQRRFGGAEQKTLSGKERLANVRRLLSLRKGASAEGRYVLLVDDIVTTGASMAVAVSLLQRAGAAGVICLCIAQD